MSYLRTTQGKLTFINARSGKYDLVRIEFQKLALGCKVRGGGGLLVFGAVQGVSQISEDLFRCEVGTIAFLGFDVSPSLDLQVTVSDNSCRLELVQCRVRESGSCAFLCYRHTGFCNVLTGLELSWQLSTEEAKTSPRFRTGLISSLSLIPEENAESSSAPEYMLVIDTQVFIDLEVYTFPFNTMPASVIEKPGNRLAFAKPDIFRESLAKQ